MLSRRSSLARLVKVAAAFASSSGATMKQLTTDLEVSRKTIHRDIEFLRDRIGLQIELERSYAPFKPGFSEYRWRATNTNEALPMIETLGRFVL